jgi:hypothetical protein
VDSQRHAQILAKHKLKDKRRELKDSDKIISFEGHVKHCEGHEVAVERNYGLGNNKWWNFDWKMKMFNKLGA